MSGFPLLLWVPRNALVITYAYNMRCIGRQCFMMLLHCTALSSTFGAHPHHPERLPNLNLMVRTHPRELDELHASVDGEDAPPWISICRTSIILLCTLHIQFGLQETHVIPISWLFSGCQCCSVVPFCEVPIGG